VFIQIFRIIVNIYFIPKLNLKLIKTNQFYSTAGIRLIFFINIYFTTSCNNVITLFDWTTITLTIFDLHLLNLFRCLLKRTTFLFKFSFKTLNPIVLQNKNIVLCWQDIKKKFLDPSFRTWWYARLTKLLTNQTAFIEFKFVFFYSLRIGFNNWVLIKCLRYMIV
jgi:hypothetical protein